MGLVPTGTGDRLIRSDRRPDDFKTMTSPFLRAALPWALCWPVLVAAQASAPTTPPLSGALRYDSVFADYKPYRDLDARPWRELNDQLRPSAGAAAAHAGHGAAPTAPPAPSPASAPASRRADTPHHQHGGAR